VIGCGRSPRPSLPRFTDQIIGVRSTLPAPSASGWQAPSASGWGGRPGPRSAAIFSGPIVSWWGDVPLESTENVVNMRDRKCCKYISSNSRDITFQVYVKFTLIAFCSFVNLKRVVVTHAVYPRLDFFVHPVGRGAPFRRARRPPWLGDFLEMNFIALGRRLSIECRRPSEDISVNRWDTENQTWHVKGEKTRSSRLCEAEVLDERSGPNTFSQITLRAFLLLSVVTNIVYRFL